MCSFQWIYMVPYPINQMHYHSNRVRLQVRLHVKYGVAGKKKKKKKEWRLYTGSFEYMSGLSSPLQSSPVHQWVTVTHRSFFFSDHCLTLHSRQSVNEIRHNRLARGISVEKDTEWKPSLLSPKVCLCSAEVERKLNTIALDILHSLTISLYEI